MKIKFIAFLFFVIVAAIGAAILWQSNSGYVLITNNTWQLETSLSRFLIILIPTAILIYGCIRLLFFIFSFWRRYKTFSKHRHIDQAYKSTIHGLTLLLEGRWKKAEKALIKDIAHNQFNLLNYLLAARAAQNSGKEEQRDRYLRQAHETTPQAEVAIGITQADLQIDAEQYEMALATLERLKQISPKHPYVTKQIARLYTHLDEWNAFLKLLPEIRKYNVFSADELIQLEHKAYMAVLRDKALTKNLHNLLDLWKSTPSELKRNAHFVEEYCLELNRLSEAGKIEAERILREFIQRDWEESLVRMYGLIELEDPTPQLKVTEKWNEKHGRSPMLMLTLARLCFRLQLWGKSRVYYESSIALHPTATAYAELSNLLDSKLDEHDKAIDYLRDGLNIATNTRAGKRITDKTWVQRADDKIEKRHELPQLIVSPDK